MRKLSVYDDVIHDFSGWQITDSNPVNINWYGSHTGNIFKVKSELFVKQLSQQIYSIDV